MQSLQLKGLTICQPYAHLIITPQEQLPPPYTAKRVENRRWFTPYRGLLAIHAGKGRSYLGPSDEEALPGMIYGAVVGVAELTAIVRLDGRLPPGLHWVREHEHAEGPFCWVLDNVRRLREPYPLRGQLGLFDLEVPIDLMPE